MTLPLEGVARLGHLGVIGVAGEDAASFLQGQLTQDFALLGPAQARLAAYCSPKGRMLATFIGFRQSAGDILLVTTRDILPATLKRLSMFVLRAKAKLRDASDEFAVYGVAGAPASQIGLQEPWDRADRDGATSVALYPADGIARALVVAPADAPAPSGPALDVETWQWSQVRSGIASVTQPVVDAFVPQMLNYESVGGVNFKKGCYPGQEVVARSQFRGTLKRRAFLAHANGELHAGQEIVAETDPSQPCGTVVQAARNPSGGWDAIVSLQIAAAGGALHAGSADGASLSVSPAPYPLLADV